MDGRSQSSEEVGQAFKKIVEGTYKLQKALKEYTHKSTVENTSRMDKLSDARGSRQAPIASSCRDMLVDHRYLRNISNKLVDEYHESFNASKVVQATRSRINVARR